jgi:hypothetical protein
VDDPAILDASGSRRSGAAIFLDQQLDGRIAHARVLELDDFIHGERMRRG